MVRLGKAGARDAFPKIDAAILAERGEGYAGAHVDLLQVAARREDQAPAGAVFAFPVIDAVIGGVAFHTVGPDLLTGSRIEREDGAVFTENVHDAIHDHRVEAEPVARARHRVMPR